jgi:Helix-turn-helix domain
MGAAYSGRVDAANELAQFLSSRRAKVTPEQAGLPSYGQRRVPGLRREEVASLAGVSVDYYKVLSAGTQPAPPTPSWKHSPTPCSLTTPSARTSSIW